MNWSSEHFFLASLSTCGSGRAPDAESGHLNPWPSRKLNPPGRCPQSGCWGLPDPQNLCGDSPVLPPSFPSGCSGPGDPHVGGEGPWEHLMESLPHWLREQCCHGPDPLLPGRTQLWAAKGYAGMGHVHLTPGLRGAWGESTDTRGPGGQGGLTEQAGRELGLTVKTQEKSRIWSGSPLTQHLLRASPVVVFKVWSREQQQQKLWGGSPTMCFNKPSR